MGLPGHHRTSSDKRKRAAHFHLDAAHPSLCAKCKKPVMSHKACAFCGTYKGREVIKMNVLGAAKPSAKAAEAKAPKAVKKTAAEKTEKKAAAKKTK
jgi:large subunit ribosomal protein L32